MSKESSRKYYLRHRERKLAYAREYYRTNREEVLARVKVCQQRRVEREKRKLMERN